VVLRVFDRRFDGLLWSTADVPLKITARLQDISQRIQLPRPSGGHGTIVPALEQLGELV